MHILYTVDACALCRLYCTVVSTHTSHVVERAARCHIDDDVDDDDFDVSGLRYMRRMMLMRVDMVFTVLLLSRLLLSLTSSLQSVPCVTLRTKVLVEYFQD
jgi:hypothetical protein